MFLLFLFVDSAESTKIRSKSVSWPPAKLGVTGFLGSLLTGFPLLKMLFILSRKFVGKMNVQSTEVAKRSTFKCVVY